MGYYVSIEESTFMIPAENLDAAYKAMCQLNFTVPNSQKRGGSWPGKDNAPEFGPDKSTWFSWMEWDYHETCKDAGAILTKLGFYTEYDEAGNLHIRGYDSKTGQEKLFLESICTLANGYIVWTGECGEYWGETYGGSKVIVRYRDRDFSDLVDMNAIRGVTVKMVEPDTLAGQVIHGLLPEGTL
jgi:hypothetical protein